MVIIGAHAGEGGGCARLSSCSYALVWSNARPRKRCHNEAIVRRGQAPGHAGERGGEGDAGNKEGSKRGEEKKTCSECSERNLIK